jgi:DnaJ-class molecular chaperone
MSSQKQAKRRVRCGRCDGTGRVGSEYYDQCLKLVTRQFCGTCVGAGYVTK